MSTSARLLVRNWGDSLITQISIRNFRSIKSQDFDVNRITTFVGANDAGKSNILRALNLFFNGQTDPGIPFNPAQDFNHFVTPGRRKARQAQIKILIDLPKRYRREGLPHQVEWLKVWRDGGEIVSLGHRTYVGGRNFDSYSKIPKLLDRINFTYVPAIKDRAFFNDLQGRLYDVLASVAAEPLRASADAFEQQLQAQLEALLESIRAMFGGEITMRLPANLRGIFENLEIQSGGIPLSRRGDGIKIRHIPMLLKFIAQKHDEIMTMGGSRFTHIWGFEEPENNVEMSSAFKMADDFCEIIENNHHYQLLMTTHSPIFYRMNIKDGSPVPTITTHFIEKIDNESTITTRHADQVDATMGLMPLVAPYVLEAKARFDEAIADHTRMKAIANLRCPTLLVEGPTDKMVLEKVLAVLAPGALPNLHINDGGDGGGGANALCSRSLAWLLEMKHRTAPNRVQAMALFDKDEAGELAKKRLAEDMEKISVKGVGQFLVTYPPAPPHFQALFYRHQLEAPIDLEAFYPDEIWELAENRGWLEGTGPKIDFKNNALIAMVQGGQNPLANFSPAARRRVMNTFSDNGKVSAARYIRDLPEADARRILSPFAPLAQKMVDQLTGARGQIQLNLE